MARIGLIVISLCIGSWVCARPQEPAPPRVNYLRLAQEFLTSLYPDLNGKGYVVTLETSFRYDLPIKENTTFDLYIGEGPKDSVVGYLGGYEGTTPPKEPLRAGPVTAKQLLISSFQFSDEKLLSFAAKGPSLGNPKSEDEVFGRVYLHPEISDQEAAAILKTAGAKYGPADKDAFVKQLPTEKLRPLIGSITAISAAFPVLDRNGVRGRWPEWCVTAKTRSAAGEELTYEMWFEPFKGDLVRISVVSSAASGK